MKTNKHTSITKGIKFACLLLFMFCGFYSNAQNKNKEKHAMVVIPDVVRKKIAEQERLNELNANKNPAELNSAKVEIKENSNNNRK